MIYRFQQIALARTIGAGKHHVFTGKAKGTFTEVAEIYEIYFLQHR